MKVTNQRNVAFSVSENSSMLWDELENFIWSFWKMDVKIFMTHCQFLKFHGNTLFYCSPYQKPWCEKWKHVNVMRVCPFAEYGFFQRDLECARTPFYCSLLLFSLLFYSKNRVCKCPTLQSGEFALCLIPVPWLQSVYLLLPFTLHTLWMVQ